MLHKPVKSFINTRKGTSILVVLLGVISQIATIIIPVSIGKYYQLAFDFNARRMQFLSFVPDTWWNTIPKFLIVFLSLIIVRYVLFFVYRFFLKRESEIFIKQIKDKLFTYQMYIDNEIYKEKGVGRYLLRYSGDINSLKNLYLKGGITVWVDAFVIILALSWLAHLSWLGTLVIVLGAILGYFIVHFFNKKIEEYSIQKRNKTSGQLSFVSRTLHAIKSVVLLNKQKVEIKKYKKKSENIKNAAIRFNTWQIINKGFISFLQYAILTLVLFVMYATNGKQISGANLISFILLYITILPIIRRFFALETVYKMGNISVEKLQNILTLKTENTLKGKELQEKEISLSFKNVKLANARKSITFSSEENTISALQVPEKVTTLSLIENIMAMRLDFKGKIKVNTQNIKKISKESLRNRISIVSPQIPLLGRSVYETITEFRAKRIEENTNTILQEIQQKFEVTPLKLNDIIGENGSNITELQYEILCFIRGLNTSKKILLVDEFKQLDTNIMMQLLNKQQKTVILLEKSKI